METRYLDYDVNREQLIAGMTQEAELRFGRRTDRRTLHDAVRDAATELLSRPSHVWDYLPELTVNQVSRSLAAG